MEPLEKRILKNGIEYILCGDYYLPNLKIPTDDRPMGRFGRLHLNYLRHYRPVVLTQLTFYGNLAAYLADINEQATEMQERIMEQMRRSEDVSEELKEQDGLEWTRRMNSIRNRAEEIVLQELIYN